MVSKTTENILAVVGVLGALGIGGYVSFNEELKGSSNVKRGARYSSIL